MREELVRQVLGLDEGDKLNERGIYPPPPSDELEPMPAGSDSPGRGEVILSPEWLEEHDAEEYFASDEKLAAALPRGRVKRLGIEPRVLVLEDVPEPTVRRGQVSRLRRGAWVVDARGEPSAIAVPAADHDHEVVIWGEAGDVRLYDLRRG
jgi:hypothetical protein